VNILITICGRGGSKGVPGKNIRPLYGVPLLFWSLYDAYHAFANREDFSISVVVDSDSQEILNIASKFAPTPICHLRPKDLGGDRTPKMAAIRQAFLDVEKSLKKSFDVLIDLDITSPLRTTEDIKGCFSTLLKEHRDVVFSVVPARRNPYFNMVEMDSEGKVVLSKLSAFVSRQEAPQVYEMNASIYAYRTEIFRSNSNITPTALNAGIWLMKDHGVLDIDSEEDFELMEWAMQKAASSGGNYFSNRFLGLKK